MLKRISKIQGIGTYANCSGGPAEFQKTSLIFGYNSHGKSTLTSIFRSIETNNVEEIKARLTIPDGNGQAVTLSMHLNEKGYRHEFDGMEWSKATHNFNWRVFDSGFISRNVMSGDNIERSNKENLSKFVLGEEGVKKSNEIASLRQASRRLKSDQKKYLEQVSSLAHPGNIKDFLSLKTEMSSGETLGKYNEAASKASSIRESIKNIAQSKSRPPLKYTPALISFCSILERIQTELSVSLADVHAGARIRLDEHVKNHMMPGAGHRDWISTGMDFQKDEECPFCEQKLSTGAKELIAAYQANFDDDFAHKSSAIKHNLANLEQELFRHHIDLSADEVNNNVILLYSEISELPPFSNLKNRLFSFRDDLKEEVALFFEKASKHLDKAGVAIQKKRNSLFEQFELDSFNDLKLIELRIRERINFYNKTVDEINLTIENYKFSLNEKSLREEEAKFVEEANSLHQLLKRLDNELVCHSYLEGEANIKEADAKIESLQEQLALEQSEYLEKFFDKIDSYFKIFGSRDFAISKTLEEKGDFPVYSLTVKYKGKDISLKKIASIFSESDKRALALSIFWASISILDTASLNNTIVVLDDPVTSFDDNRISSAIKEFKLFAETLRQLIILSHYAVFASRFLESEKVGGHFSLLRLEKDDKSTQITIGEPKDFLNSEHQKKFDNIQRFIARQQATPIDADLRIFLETEVRNRYRQQIVKLNIENVMFSDLIDTLDSNAAFSNSSIAKELHRFREDLNSPHHQWNNRTEDDWSSFAEEMLDLIYTKL